MPNYDAVLLLSFGGPECMDDVLPFLRNVVRGRNVPEARLQEVAHHYELFAGRSPINEQNRALLAALRIDLEGRGIHLPVYWGNRNWHPLLTDTVRQMQADGVQRALAFVTSAYSSYSGCRQYREDIERARGDGAPAIEKLDVFFDQPRFIAANAARVRSALETIGEDAMLVFTAHSIPLSMASNCQYEQQLKRASQRVAEAVGAARWVLVYQSRSGPPTQAWLEPDLLDYLRSRPDASPLVVVPIGFVSDHVEVLYDLDYEARTVCEARGIPMARAQTVGVHEEFVRMVGDMIADRLKSGQPPRICGADCCLHGGPTSAITFGNRC